MINLITLLVHANAKIVNYVVISSGKAFVSSFFFSIVFMVRC